MKPQPLITVHDVSASRDWYANILGLSSGHGGDEYERMMSDDRMVLQLHRWDTHEHSHLGDPSLPIGNGAILWFQTDQFDEIVAKVQTHDARVLEEPHINPNANHREIWLSDPDGYTVVVAGPPGDV
ncbi:MAG: VOC family protein [Cyanobacteria bacterium P01_D01_bin.56]